jgi:hypothetical protein
MQAQNVLDGVYLPDSSRMRPTKKYDLYAGVQANLLLRELLNFSDNNDPIANPYLLIFSAHSVKTHWGLNLGFGYRFNRVKDVNTPADHVSDINDLFFRLGIGRKVEFGKRFEAGYGFDFLLDYLADKTTTVTILDQISQVDSTVSETNSRTTAFGGGFQGSLAFRITPKILLGTEATYYFKYSLVKQNVEVTNYTRFVSTGQEFVDYSNFNSESHVMDFTFTVPVSLFLILKF